jgi:hypothetical protein
MDYEAARASDFSPRGVAAAIAGVVSAMQIQSTPAPSSIASAAWMVEHDAQDAARSRRDGCGLRLRKGP